MRRLVLLLGAGAMWLFLAALPALADGGPHVASINNGSSSLTADSCAGCHRIHTAEAPMLLKTDEEALCLSCHGAATTGATTDVATGIQYVPASDGTRTGTQLGALRNGGFVEARIGTDDPARVRYGTQIADFYAKVGVGVSGPVTSAHLPELAGLTQPGRAWGNGANGSGPGPVVDISCGTCHNPHGNGQYRILNPIPLGNEPPPGFTPIPAPGQPVIDSPADNPDPAESDTKNYTVIQIRGTQGDDGTFLLYADDVLDGGYGPTTGDYWHRYVPWLPASTTARGSDAPNGRPSSFNLQMINWCSACHTRYNSPSGGERVDPITGDPDPIYHWQHQTSSNSRYNTACTTCHVSHGTNASMAVFSASVPYPNGDVPGVTPGIDNGASRLLKIDNRGTCQACHDPTDTTAVGDYDGPIPMPGIP